MNYNYNEDYQYDSCVSRGICSINPKTSALQEVLVLYLRETAYYALKLYNNKISDDNSRNIILNTISIMVSNFEFSEMDFRMLTSGYNKTLPLLIEKYKKMCEDLNLEPEILKTPLKFNSTFNINKSVQLGEKEFLKKSNNLSAEVGDLFKISFVLAKSICINILDLESFDDFETNEISLIEEGYFSILSLLNLLNSETLDKDIIKTLMIKIAKVDNSLMKLLLSIKEKRYGKPISAEVSYSTVPGKAILVVGSNIRELEDILEAFKNEEVDVYTHDEMILANMYPKFRKYKNLKGQFGQGIENCLLDFATFPGPIILTKHSLYNVEHLYRGLLFTTDIATSKGIIRIKDRNFDEVIESAKASRGFKTGKVCESIQVGFDYENIFKQIKEKIDNYSHIFIIGLGAYTLEQKTYFEKLLNQTPENVLIISLSYCISKNNIICLDSCIDSSLVTQIIEDICEETSKPVTIFFPKCSRHSISQMIYLSEVTDASIYVGKCTPILLNPNMVNTLNKVFGINGLTSVRKDLENIIV